MKKAIAVIVIMVLLITMISSVQAKNDNSTSTSKGEICIEYHGNGYFTRTTKETNKASENIYTVKEYKNNVYKLKNNKDLPFKIVVQVDENKFQATGELVINKKKFKEKKDVVDNYNVPDYMMDKVNKFFSDENLNPNAELTIFSPDLITEQVTAINDGITTRGITTNYYYYWGTGGYYYKHEDLWATNWTSNVASRNIDEDEWDAYISDAFVNTIKTLIGAVTSVDPWTAGANMIASILYNPDLITGSSNQNTLSCQQVEDKHIQYESIQYPGSTMSLKVIVERSVVDYHCTTIVDGVWDDGHEYNLVWQAPNFWNGSTLCYNYRNNTLVYREEIQKHEKFDFYFTSF